MVRQLIAPVYQRLNVFRYPAVLPYLVLGLLAAAVFGALAWLDRFLTPTIAVWHLGILLTASLLFGILLAWMFECKLFTKDSLARRGWLVLAVVLWGMLVFALRSPAIGLHGSDPVYLQVYWPALFTAVFPWFCFRAVTTLAKVPQLRFRLVRFDSLKDVIAYIRFAEDDTRGIRWVFEDDFTETDASGRYAFPTFLPKDLKNYSIEELFKGVISLHNITECPESPIDFKDYGWEFHDYPYWFWHQRRRYLNPYKPMRPGRFHFRKLSDSERAKSVVKLIPGFCAATIHITRTKSLNHVIN